VPILLPRSATGQKLSCYTQFISGPPRTDAETAALKTIAATLDMSNASQWRAALQP